MTFVELFLTAIALAMDCTAVAVSLGLSRRVRASDALRIGLMFGGFQAAMPALGWIVGTRVASLVDAHSNWIAFGLLVAVGVKMLDEARHADDEAAEGSLSLPSLVPLAVATSIDALAVGVGLPVMHAPFATSLTVIGVVSFVLSIVGAYAGRRAGKHVGSRLDALGGIVLIALGVKMLLAKPLLW